MTSNQQRAMVERILVELARKFAPRLAPNTWRKPGDLKKPTYMLARQLANYHVLVLQGARQEQVSGDIPSVVRECADLFTRFYHLLVDALFPSSLQRIRAAYLSYSRDDLIIYFEADAGPVIQIMAGFVAPYVAQRQQASQVTIVELYGLMDRILEVLDADDLDPDTVRHLRERGAAILMQMLQMRLRLIELTRFDEPMIADIHHLQPPNTVPEAGKTRPFIIMEDVNGAVPDFIREILANSGQVSPPTDETLGETGPQPAQQQDAEQRKRAEDNKAETGSPGNNDPKAPIPRWIGGKKKKNSS